MKDGLLKRMVSVNQAAANGTSPKRRHSPQSLDVRLVRKKKEETGQVSKKANQANKNLHIGLHNHDGPSSITKSF